MIVVCGTPAWTNADPARPAGGAGEVALGAPSRGRPVGLIGRIGDDPTGDGLVIALARAGVGHAAVLRDPSRATVMLEPPDLDDPTAETARTIDAFGSAPRLEAADVSLALSYLTTFGVLVVTNDV